MKPRRFRWPAALWCAPLLAAVAVLCAWFHTSRRPDVAELPRREGDYAVVLHGLGLSHHWMYPLAAHLRSEGFSVVNISYPSTTRDIGYIADSVVAPIVRKTCPDTTRRVHFVTHSMGGLVLRRYLNAHGKEVRVGRVVMIAPPNRGSEIVDSLGSHVVLDALFGPAYRQLSAAPGAFASGLGPLIVPAGVIAGDRSLDPIGSRLIPGPDDGRVGVHSVVVEGVTEMVVLDQAHSSLPFSPTVWQLAATFLREGSFGNGGHALSASPSGM